MIGNRIKEFREDKGLKIKAFADLIGISQGTLSDIENGKTKPSAETLSKIVRNTDIDSLWLLTGGRPVITQESELAYHAPMVGDDPQIMEMVKIMRDLDKQARLDLLRQAKKELELKLLKLNNQVKSEFIDALEPRTFEQKRKLKRKEEPVAEKQETKETKISSSIELSREHLR